MQQSPMPKFTGLGGDKGVGQQIPSIAGSPAPDNNGVIVLNETKVPVTVNTKALPSPSRSQRRHSHGGELSNKAMDAYDMTKEDDPWLKTFRVRQDSKCSKS